MNTSTPKKGIRNVISDAKGRIKGRHTRSGSQMWLRRPDSCSDSEASDSCQQDHGPAIHHVQEDTSGAKHFDASDRNEPIGPDTAGQLDRNDSPVNQSPFASLPGSPPNTPSSTRMGSSPIASSLSTPATPRSKWQHSHRHSHTMVAPEESADCSSEVCTGGALQDPPSEGRLTYLEDDSYELDQITVTSIGSSSASGGPSNLGKVLAKISRPKAGHRSPPHRLTDMWHATTQSIFLKIYLMATAANAIICMLYILLFVVITGWQFAQQFAQWYIPIILFCMAIVHLVLAAVFFASFMVRLRNERDRDTLFRGSFTDNPVMADL